eukprot:CAMPEP_0171457742 /NCGR_PEP_ID=MMETSP0945-20130129/3699_1 /TAXON_ID=109269 /ORGANISM="Vaucheria litorea, Strain CCMP2940" /LENGTH=454 /DNA_ID=CAMNT_0011983411 /DNA_START=58 /DNA_END=1420 /DNA_ORIENTATION=-
MVVGKLQVDTSLLTKIRLALESHPSAPYDALRGLLSDASPTVSSKDTDAFTDGSDSDSSARRHAASNCKVYDEDSAVNVCDLGEIKSQFYTWRALLPRIDPWYAVKCNPFPEIVQTLAALGNGMDCASKSEIELALSMGVQPSNIIFANPCKSRSHLRYARDKGVTLVTFDSEDELVKISRYHPSARLVLRLLVDDSSSVCRFGEKYGAPLETVPSLFARVKQLGLNLVGVSFHVGSGCRDPKSFSKAVESAKEVFKIAGKQGLPPLTLLDCGGGFPGSDNFEYTGEISFQAIALELSAAVDFHFPDKSVKIIAEPGRYFVSSCTALLTQIHSKKKVTKDHVRAMYYLNDGVYGSFNCIMFDHYVVCPKVLTRNGNIFDERSVEESNANQFPSNLWGPTCDSMDCVMKNVELPELEIGDWLCFPNMGAYTSSAASNFNGLYTTLHFSLTLTVDD